MNIIIIRNGEVTYRGELISENGYEATFIDYKTNKQKTIPIHDCGYMLAESAYYNKLMKPIEVANNDKKLNKIDRDAIYATVDSVSKYKEIRGMRDLNIPRSHMSIKDVGDIKGIIIRESRLTLNNQLKHIRDDEDLTDAERKTLTSICQDAFNEFVKFIAKQKGRNSLVNIIENWPAVLIEDQPYLYHLAKLLKK